MSDSPDWRSRGYLPHFDNGQALQATTYRLADSLPAQVCRQLEERTLDDAKRREAIEHYLDAGHGSCLLRDPYNAAVTLATLHSRNGQDYRLHAWVIMPNHLHVLVEPLSGKRIGQIVAAWKGVSARGILRSLAGAATGGGDGPAARHVWQHDYFDRFIRHECHYRSAVDYIHQNPVSAGLVARPEDWPWSSAAR